MSARTYVAKTRHARPCPVCVREIVPGEKCLTWMQRTPAGTFAIQRVHDGCELRLRVDRRAGRTAAVERCTVCTDGVVDPASRACGNCGAARAAVAPRSPHVEPAEISTAAPAGAPSRAVAHQLLDAYVDGLVEAARLDVATWRPAGGEPPTEDARRAASMAMARTVTSARPLLLDACVEVAAAEAGLSPTMIRKRLQC